jgi:hypothetical protein
MHGTTTHARTHSGAGSAVYRRLVANDGTLNRPGGGIPEWTDGRVDSRYIASRESVVTRIDLGGRLHLPVDEGASWPQPVGRFGFPRGLNSC